MTPFHYWTPPNGIFIKAGEISASCIGSTVVAKFSFLICIPSFLMPAFQNLHANAVPIQLSSFRLAVADIHCSAVCFIASDRLRHINDRANAFSVGSINVTFETFRLRFKNEDSVCQAVIYSLSALFFMAENHDMKFICIYTAFVGAHNSRQRIVTNGAWLCPLPITTI